MSTATYEHPLIPVEGRFQALPRKTTSPQGIDWDYPYGKGTATVLAVTGPDEGSEYGTRPYEAVWFALEGEEEVQALHPRYFLQSFSRL